jgi:hypothetical protein
MKNYVQLLFWEQKGKRTAKIYEKCSRAANEIILRTRRNVAIVTMRGVNLKTDTHVAKRQ